MKGVFGVVLPAAVISMSSPALSKDQTASSFEGHATEIARNCLSDGCDISESA